ncbi:MAG TPA: glycosyltransferase family 4 protein [Solirubrobacteraceae bacterium]|nr:glycosyltransferase family 4 protein [Solirubrobacteraceae bacterium]
MRLCVYTDYAYSQADGSVYGQRAFVAFMCEVGSHFEELVVLGRFDPQEGRSRYPLPPDVRFVGLPFYESLTKPLRVLIALLRSLRRVWHELGEVDVVWLLGPYLHSFAYALLAVLRGRRIVLGVRQELVRYTRTRHPGRRALLVAAHIEEAGWRLLARFAAVVVVGPSLADSYRHARSLLPISVSLVRERDIVEPASVRARSYDGELCVLAVGRLDAEKNPLLLADVLAELRKREPRWRLIVCGEGSLEQALQERLRELDMAEHAELLGYIPFAELREIYRNAHAFLHVSWTEGVPQVLFESWAAALPVIATAVGGVPEAAAGAALLIPSGDATAAAEALYRVVSDVSVRASLIDSGYARVRERTLEREAAAVADFIGAR